MGETDVQFEMVITMFGFLKKNKLSKEDINFLNAVVCSLPEKYSYLKEQVSEDFMLGKKPNPLGEDNCYTLTLNANLEKKYSNHDLPRFFILEGIKVLNKKSDVFEYIELHILEGMLAGYQTKADLMNLDTGKIDCSGLKEKLFDNQDKIELSAILGDVKKDLLSIFDIENTFKIEIDEGVFFVLKDLGDGNYLSINQEGSVFGMIHDPYEVEKIFETKKQFFDALKSREFKIKEYYNSKF